MSAELKLGLILGSLIAVIIGTAFSIRGIYEAGKGSGRNEVQTAWNADKLARQQEYDRQLAENQAKLTMAIKANEAIQNDYQKKLDDALANAGDFSRRLRDAAAKLTASISTLSKVGDLAGSAQASAQRSTDLLGQLVSHVTDLRTECIENDAQLDAIVAQIRPQL